MMNTTVARRSWRWVLLLGALLPGACAQLPIDARAADPAALRELLGAAEPMERPPILELDNAMRELIDRTIDHGWSTQRKFDELRRLIFGSEYLDLHYDASRTRTALETFQTGAGNCLSMTNLFIAMARHVGLDARYHLVPTLPWWDNQANTVIWNEHINATGRLQSGTSYVLDFVPYTTPPIEHQDRVVSDRYAEALYFNNLGAEALVRKEHDLALRRFRQALQLEPAMANVWNNMAIVQNRLGREDLMEAALLQALSEDPEHQTAMSNLASLYDRQGRTEEALVYHERIRHHREANPFFLYARATGLLDDGDVEGALRLLNRAIRMDRRRPAFYLARHRAYELAGDAERGARDLQRATELRERGSPNGRALFDELPLLLPRLN